MEETGGSRLPRFARTPPVKNLPSDAELPALHRRLFTIDTHTDTPTASLGRAGWDFGARHDVATDHSQCDLPRMEAGGIDAMVFAVYSTQAARTLAGYAAVHAAALGVLARTREILEQNAGRCALALTAADGPRLKAEGRRAIYLSIENG